MHEIHSNFGIDPIKLEVDCTSPLWKHQDQQITLLSTKLEAEVSLLKCLALRALEHQVAMEKLHCQNQHILFGPLRASQPLIASLYEEISTKYTILCELLQALSGEKDKTLQIITSASTINSIKQDEIRMLIQH